MDSHGSEADGHKQPVSVLEGDDSYFHRILSREPMIGNSSRHYQYRSPGQIPFQWEKQPGECKFDPPKRDPIDVPRIKPPPISASKSMKLLSRPDNSGGPNGSSSSWLKTKFWRMIKKKKSQLTTARSKSQARGSEAVSKCSSNGSSRTSSDDNLMSSSSNLSLPTSSSTTLCLPFAALLRSSNSAKGHIDWPF